MLNATQVKELNCLLSATCRRRQDAGDPRHVNQIVEDILAEAGAPDISETLAALRAISAR